MEISCDLLETFPGDAGRDECIVQLAVDRPVITDLQQVVHSHHHHEPEIRSDLFQVGLPCGSGGVCSRKTLCCKSITFSHDEREDVVGEKVREHL